MTLLDLTPEECRALGREIASRACEAASERWRDKWWFNREPWPIEWSPEGYAWPVPPKGEA